ncbi:DNA-protecting protein DprA [Rathayibacter sp. AY2B3]|uniref:DNA-processing protein DprA n=1 Tax=unclassified Rathayibacter TaxID=2609250 RepID=UPI000CE82899|nr:MULTISPECIES: DNA-processing protein DprA [unclassified Rathayibacter]PPG50631.1 DNA-protecting protein DprA [Rathayibacter sp. AY2B3]PPI23579.1 DNA-protecting protein DprA [Rathayibacter sp. AY1B6]PPI32660.1 DNA-protecting protein DprA [Rathayibacter sp. AY1B1]
MIRPDSLFDAAELDAVRRLLPSSAADPGSAAERTGESDGARSELVDAAARCAWNSLTEPGDSVAALLIERVGPAEAFAHVVSSSSAEEILAPPHRAPSEEGDPASALLGSEVAALQSGLTRWRPRLDRRLLFRRLEIAERLGARLLLPGAPEWPESLDDLGPHAPLLLWLRGDPAAFAPPHRLALVGARAATGYGEHVAAELAAGVATRGVSVVSGGAFGIDAVAHRAALGSGGRTVAFLAGGADRLYPTAHADLLHRIIATPGCGVATEVPPGTTPTRWRFLQRNRLIAASTAGTVVVEAGARSGSLNTAGHAAALGRPLGAVPGPVTSASSAGCHRLLREYAATCVTSPPDVLELLGVGDEDGTRRALTAAETRVLAVVDSEGGCDAATVARLAGESLDSALSALGALLADGRVHRSEDGDWERSPG